MFNRYEPNNKNRKCGKVKSKNSDEFDLLSLRYNFIECNGTLEEFERMSVGEVLDFIYTYINMKNKQTNHNNNKNNNRQNISQEDVVCYGRVADDGHIMTLEEIMAME